MSQPQIIFSNPCLPIPTLTLKKPFAVLLDTRDPEWADSSFLDRRIVELVGSGCRYFVCFGPDSECVHDQIDEVLVKHAYIGVPTTFHVDEAAEDVANFFVTVGMSGMAQGLVHVHSQADWRASFDFLL
jgi:hypothetical protein